MIASWTRPISSPTQLTKPPSFRAVTFRICHAGIPHSSQALIDRTKVESKRSLPLLGVPFPKFGHNSHHQGSWRLFLRSMASITLNFPRAESQNAIQGFCSRFFGNAAGSHVRGSSSAPSSGALAHWLLASGVEGVRSLRSLLERIFPHQPISVTPVEAVHSRQGSQLTNKRSAVKHRTSGTQLQRRSPILVGISEFEDPGNKNRHLLFFWLNAPA